MSPFIHTAGPHTALIKSSGRRDVRVVIGGRMFALPIFQRVDRLGLELRTITVHTKSGTTINGVAVDVTSCCQVKIQGWSTATEGDDVPAGRRSPVGGDLHMDYSAIRLAAQHFIGKKDSEIEGAIQKTVSGHQRAIIGELTVEQLYRDRAAFSKRVLNLCYDDMRNMGLTVVSYTVAEITDERGYIEALGVKQTELVKRQAAEAKAAETAQTRSTQAQEGASAHLEENTQKGLQIESDKIRSIKKAEAQREVDLLTAVQQKAYDIASAEQDAVLFVEKQKARAAEAQAELAVMKQRVEKERLLKQQQVHVEADARLYRARVDAESITKAAEAEAQKTRLVGIAKADIEAAMIRERGEAKAEADALLFRRRGEAEADVARAKGLAEVAVKQADLEVQKDRWIATLEYNRARLKNWQEFGNQGMLIEQVIDKLPEIAAAIAAPLSKTEKMVFVGSGGAGGPAQFTKEMNRMVAELPETVNALTGVDFVKGIANLTSARGGSQIVAGLSEGLGSAVMEHQLERKFKHKV